MQRTALFLYDQAGSVLFLSNTVPPYKSDQFIGRPGWEIMLPGDVDRYQAAVFRVLNTGSPEQFDAGFHQAGRWRITLYRCATGRSRHQLGKARIIGMAQKFPEEVLHLTPRQVKICQCLAAGMASKQIAAKLGISRATVDNHRANIARAVGIHPKSVVAWCGSRREWLE